MLFCNLQVTLSNLEVQHLQPPGHFKVTWRLEKPCFATPTSLLVTFFNLQVTFGNLEVQSDH